MARRLTELNGGAPPPSTLAAQIVQNHAQPNVQAGGDGDATSNHLQFLLHELLHNPDAHEETDISVNVKLISVCAEAGLTPLTIDNPFAQRDEQIARAKDTIAVIEKTVKRQPATLVTPISADGPQLVIPLFAGLAAICGRPGCEDIPAASLIETCVRSVEASPQLWKDAKYLQCLCQGMAMRALSAAESGQTPVRLPSSESIFKLWRGSESAIALPHGFQTSIDNDVHAFMLALQLSRSSTFGDVWRKDMQLRLQKLAWKLKPRLKRSNQWIVTLRLLLDGQDSALLVQNLLVQRNEEMPDPDVQDLVASWLARSLATAKSCTKYTLLPVLQTLVADSRYQGLHEHLRIMTAAWLLRFVPIAQLPEHITRVRYDVGRIGDKLDSDFVGTLYEYPEQAVNGRDLFHGHKRRKLVAEPEHADLIMGEDNVEHYGSLAGDQQMEVWRSLGRSANLKPEKTLDQIRDIITLPSFRDNDRSRVVSISTIQICVKHLVDGQHLHLKDSVIGQHVLGAIHSSCRELRVAGGECLPFFLRDGLATDILSNNRHVALEYLRVLSERDEISEHETLIPLWGQIAIVCGEHERNIALLRLVDYLGHPHSIIAAAAFGALENVALARAQRVEHLLKPYWNTIAVVVVQDLSTRPQKIQRMADLLGISVNEFLVKTQQYTVPTLVSTGRKDILQRIAALRPSGSVTELCTNPRGHLSAILGLLLIQPVPDVEEHAIQRLAAVSEDFRVRDLTDLVRMESVAVACELLKHCADAHEGRRSRMYRAMQSFAVLVEKRPGQSRGQAKGAKSLQAFLEAHMLGIMANLSQLIEGPQAAEGVLERLRAVKAIKEAIHLAKKHISSALPQIRACLQSAMEWSLLCDAAFSTWLDLLAVLDEEDIRPMLSQSFALIVRHWAKLSTTLQTAVHDCIGNLIRIHNQMMQEEVASLPSVASIPLLSKYAAEFERLQNAESMEARCKAFVSRLREENSIVVQQTLRELTPFLNEQQEFFLGAAVSEQPVPVLSDLFRALLDVATSSAAVDEEIAELCGKALGCLGCVDSNTIETTRTRRQVLLLSNFGKASEAVDWVLVFLEDVVVKSFRSATTSRSQGFLAFVMQELLRFCGFTSETAVARTRSSQLTGTQQKWLDLPENVRITLTPFLSSAYTILNQIEDRPKRAYPGFSVDSEHGNWLRSLVHDLLWRAKGDNAQMIFPLIARLVRLNDISIANFLLPFAVLNVVLGGTVAEIKELTQEILAVMQCRPTTDAQIETVKQAADSMFAVLDYLSSWLQEKKKVLGQTRAEAYRTGRSPIDFDEAVDMAQIEEVERFLATIPAEALTARAVECGSNARALFHWEQYIRQRRPLIPSPRMEQADEAAYAQLHDIYARIDEPDGLEGIGTHLSFLTESQQTIQHIKSGRWTAALAWYETALTSNQDEEDMQIGLLNCLRETGQYAALSRYAKAFMTRDGPAISQSKMVLTIESCWMTGDMPGLYERLSELQAFDDRDLSTSVGRLIKAVAFKDTASFTTLVKSMRTSIIRGLTEPLTTSLQACHGELLKLHVLYEVEALATMDKDAATRFLKAYNRLGMLGSYTTDKQYLLGVRRAIMKVRGDAFTPSEIGSLWLGSARMARKAGNISSAYDAVLHALNCGDRSAKLEQARLLWHDGHQRQAIQALNATITSDVFKLADTGSQDNSGSMERGVMQSYLTAKAHLKLAKWLDASGQSQMQNMQQQYQAAARSYQRWEKGHYYLGKHYNKVLELEKSLPKAKQSALFLSGELTKSVIENLMRSIPFGNKYWHETIPKVLTLWLDLGMEANGRPTRDDPYHDRRQRALQAVNNQFRKYYERIPAYVFYTALPQLLSRISHPHPNVWKELSACLTRIISNHPSQAMWYMLPVTKATDPVRAARGGEILKKLQEPKKQGKSEGVDLRALVLQSQKLADGLLQACEHPVEPRRRDASLRHDLGLTAKLTPIPLVVPVEATLSANLPVAGNADTIRKHKAFAQDKVTIQGFLDEVLVLSSLQRPKKITVRGSDGKTYGLLCKPKDDLRKDQRLMDFNGIINRALKRDAESSKRRLYIKTYAVTPLSEESGTLEWVEGIKPMRDIMLNLYGRKGVKIDYPKLREQLNQAIATPENLHIFQDEVLQQFPPVLHEWFTETYPNAETWFAARLRYARSAAVMSMTGHILGLGDRHGENILLEEGTGGVFHVDFNCLFEKGRTFEKPELVPFRLTHNMVDAMGAYGYEGPFRRSSELTLGLLRRNKDTLMTVLETFVYDPTTDFVKKKKEPVPGVPNTPLEILENVDTKLKGLYGSEVVPLGVEGYVDVLIKDATSTANLAGMYIGWCAFL